MPFETNKRTASLVLMIAVVLFISFAVLGGIQKPKNFPNAITGTDARTVEIDSLRERVIEVTSPSHTVEPGWENAKAQSDDGLWVYDVFTPPRIFINPETGDFEPTSYQFDSGDIEPELSIMEVKRPLFLFQLSGFVENSLINASQSILLIENTQNGETLRLRFKEGAVIGNGVNMKSFKISKKTTEAGAIQRVGELQIEMIDHSHLLLRSSEIAYEMDFQLRMRFGAETFELSTEEPTYQSEGYQIAWKYENTAYPDFEFEILNLDSSVIHPIFLKSYLSQDP